RAGGTISRMVQTRPREPVAFDAPLKQPLRFREAMSALHDCVISDLRFKKKDKTAYLQWKKDQAGHEEAIPRGTIKQLTGEIAQRLVKPVPPDFVRTFESARKIYW